MKFKIKDRIMRMVKEPTWGDISIMVILMLVILTTNIKCSRTEKVEPTKVEQWTVYDGVKTPMETALITNNPPTVANEDRAMVAVGYSVVKCGDIYAVRDDTHNFIYDYTMMDKESAIALSWRRYDRLQAVKEFKALNWEPCDE